MVFGLFTRKTTQDDSQTSASPESKLNEPGPTAAARLPTPTPSTVSATHYSPLRLPTTLRAVLTGSTTDLTVKDSDVASESLIPGTEGESPAPPPPETPSPPPAVSNESKELYELMVTIPAKTLHAYTLAHLRPRTPLPLPTATTTTTTATATTSTAPGLGPEPDNALNAPRPPSPDTVSKLTKFFSTLAPPPLLHCVRCHNDFYDIENEEKDKACRVPHDDESTLVDRVSGGGGYETLWGCCGQTVPGDGSEGPPDGWCYEGRHTTDVKRARFRADSTIHNDKLTSCLKLNCHGIRDQLPGRTARATPSRTAKSPTRKSNASPSRSQASVVLSRSTRKRPRKSLKEASGSEDEGDTGSVRGRTTKAKGKGKEKDLGEGAEHEDTSMAIDEPNPPPKSKAKTKPTPRARPPHSSSTTASFSGPASNVASTTITTPAPTPAKTKAKPRTPGTKPKSTARTLLSQSHTHLASDSEGSTRERPRTRSLVREESRVRDASRPRATPPRELSRTRTASKALLRESSRRKTAKRAQTPASDEEPDAEEMPEEEESEYEGRGRGRKKRRVAV